MADRGWPDDWNERMDGRECPICAAVGQGDNEFWVEVFSGELATPTQRYSSRAMIERCTSEAPS
jgi:hypothetical protein